MKLVGASNWFVRVPFMAEGLVQGVIGAGFAFGLVWALKVVIVEPAEPPARTCCQTFHVTNADAIGDRHPRAVDRRRDRRDRLDRRPPPLPRGLTPATQAGRSVQTVRSVLDREQLGRAGRELVVPVARFAERDEHELREADLDVALAQGRARRTSRAATRSSTSTSGLRVVIACANASGIASCV